MAKIALKELKTAYKVLEQLAKEDAKSATVAVPNELLSALAAKVRDAEMAQKVRKMNRMSEDELIRHESRTNKSLRVNIEEGRFIQMKTNEQTFVEAIRSIPKDELMWVNYIVRKHPLFYWQCKGQPRSSKGYRKVADKLLVYSKMTTAERIAALQYLDQRLQLNWEIELL